ncbi:MAG: hypothetical protein WB946_09585, partial [Halobacteriota archaeon]
MVGGVQLEPHRPAAELAGDLEGCTGSAEGVEDDTRDQIGPALATGDEAEVVLGIVRSLCTFPFIETCHKWLIGFVGSAEISLDFPGPRRPALRACPPRRRPSENRPPWNLARERREVV